MESNLNGKTYRFHFSIDATDAHRVIALARHLGCDTTEIELTSRDNIFKADIQAAEYLVVTDNEADDLFNDYMHGIIEEGILSIMPSNLRCYFDREKYIRDVQIREGRGPSISSYDGHESEQRVDGTYFFIYRVN